VDAPAPILITGAARSGTSALHRALVAGAGIPGDYEGHLLPLLASYRRQAARFFRGRSGAALADPGFTSARVGEARVVSDLAALFARWIAAPHGEARWVDKTPEHEMVRDLPVLLELFPAARVVFARRRGIENVLSRQRKFPRIPFTDHCWGWAATMAAWLRVRDALGDRALEVEQRTLSERPGAVLEDLVAFLGLGPESERSMVVALEGRRPEASRGSVDDWPVELEATPWSPEQRAAFQEICGPMMAAFGYMEAAPGPPGPVRFAAAGADVEHRGIPPGGIGDLGRGFVLHPPAAASEEAALRFRGVLLRGHDAFRARVALGHPRAPPVLFGLRVVATAPPALVADATLRLEPGQEVPWKVPLPPLRGRHEVWLTTRVAPDPGSNEFAWAVWTDPRFEVTPPAAGTSRRGRGGPPGGPAERG